MVYKQNVKGFWLRHIALLVCLLLVPLLVGVATVAAIARGYSTTDQGLQTGMVVALSIDTTSSTTVERATQNTSDRVVGIVTTIDNSLVTVGSSASKVLVESEGQVEGYVSDIGGNVQQGDLLVLSPLKGILMKGVKDTPATIVAIAADNPGATLPYSYTVDSKTETTNIAKIKLNLNHTGAKNSGLTTADSPLSRVGRSIVGRDVGEARVLIALIIFTIVLIAEGGILYGAISSAVTALGRNPLARKIIRAELFRVIIVAILVLVVGLGAVYGILWI